MAAAPYQKSGKWYVDKDPNDELFYVANVANDLQDSATTAVSYVVVTQNVTVLEQAAPQGVNGSLLAIKVGALAPGSAECYVTFRVTCANGEKFDRTIYFNRDEH